MSNYEVRNTKIEETLKSLGKMISAGLPKGWGFTLFLISFGAGGNMFYISSAQRADMLSSLKEFIAKQEDEKTVVDGNTRGEPNAS